MQSLYEYVQVKNYKSPHLQAKHLCFQRSLANLTAHKRSYCLDKFEDVTHIFSSKVNCEAAQLRTVIVEGETIETVVPEDNLDTENYSPSLGWIHFYSFYNCMVCFFQIY